MLPTTSSGTCVYHFSPEMLSPLPFWHSGLTYEPTDLCYQSWSHWTVLVAPIHWLTHSLPSRCLVSQMGMAEDKRGWEEKEEEEEGRHCHQACSFFSSRLFSKVLEGRLFQARWFPPVEDVTVECIDFIKAISIQGSRLRCCELSMWPSIMGQSKPFCKSLYKCILNASLKALFISMNWLVRKVLKLDQVNTNSANPLFELWSLVFYVLICYRICGTGLIKGFYASIYWKN